MIRWLLEGKHIRHLRRKVVRAHLEARASKARADYYTWRMERFEAELSSLILRIGKYGTLSPQHKVSVNEIQLFMREWAGKEVSTEDAIEFMHRCMLGDCEYLRFDAYPTISTTKRKEVVA